MAAVVVAADDSAGLASSSMLPNFMPVAALVMGLNSGDVT